MFGGANVPIPIKCLSYADYLRAKNTADYLNSLNNDYPITLVLASGSKDPNVEGIRYLELSCSSNAKIQHFLEIGQQLDKDIAKLNRTLTKSVKDSDNQTQVKESKTLYDLEKDLFDYPLGAMPLSDLGSLFNKLYRIEPMDDNQDGPESES